MDSADVGMQVIAKPDECGDQTADYGQQENPPQDAGDGIAVLGEPEKPVAAPVMQKNMITRENCQQDSKYDMQPYRPEVYAGGCIQLNAGCQHQNHDETERAVAEFEARDSIHFFFSKVNKD